MWKSQALCRLNAPAHCSLGMGGTGAGAIGVMTSRAEPEPEPRARLGCTPSSCPSRAEEDGGRAGLAGKGLAQMVLPPPQGFLHSHPTRAELLPSSQMPQLPHPDPRTSENKEEVPMPAQPGLDGAGLGPGQETGGDCPLDLAPPLLKVGSTWRCLGKQEAHSPSCRGGGPRRRPLLLSRFLPPTSSASE